MNNILGKLCVTLMILGCILFAQKTEPNIVWERIWGGDNGDVLNCVQQTSDGGYIVVGTKRSAHINPDIYCSKRDNLGNIEWERILGGDYYDEGNYVIETYDGVLSWLEKLALFPIIRNKMFIL